MYHGTDPIANANAIARKGPDIKLAGSKTGHMFGLGLYAVEANRIDIARQYAQSAGGICVCQALRGKPKTNNLSPNDTAGSLYQAGYHSVQDPTSGYIVLFHPDSVVVSHVISFGPDDSLDEQLAAERVKLQAEWEAAENQRKLQLQVCKLSNQLLSCTWSKALVYCCSTDLHMHAMAALCLVF